MIDSKPEYRLPSKDSNELRKRSRTVFFHRFSLLSVFLLLIIIIAGCGKKPRQMPIPSESGDSGSTTASDRTPTDPTAARPLLELRIEPARISPGESALLTWESQHANQVIIEPAIGEVDLSGRIKFFPEQTTTYRITASGPGGALTKSVTVLVETANDRSSPEIEEEDLRNATLEERFQSSVKPVFFGFDSAELTEEARLTLDGNIRWLTRLENQHIQFVLEGHADARGSEEYNFALADKRAQTVSEYLRNHGISESRMTALSLGEERPFDPRGTEEAYALNRRTQFVMMTPP